jgi:hypothetical protein
MTPIPFDSRTVRVLNGAASQADRLRGAPHPDRIEPDGRTMAQLLAFGARYGALVRFYDLSDTPNGNWTAFFTSDPSITLAVLGALDLPEIEAALRVVLALLKRCRDAVEQERHHHRARLVIVRLILILDAKLPWIEDADLHLVALAEARRDDGLAAPLRAWNQHHRHRPAHDDHEWHRNAADLLEDIAATLIPLLRQAATQALADLDDSLNTPGHAPQAALWNAFVTLFHEARYELNRFPRRLLDFYYDRVLRQDHRAARPSSVFLTFTLAQSATEAAVAKASLFIGGTDTAGDPIYFAADAALEVRPATVTNFGVYRVQFASDDRDAPPTGVLTGSLSAPTTSAGPASFPLFGGTRLGAYGDMIMAPATLGFILESQTLLLAGGNRAVRIVLKLAEIAPTLCVTAVPARPGDANGHEAQIAVPSIPITSLTLFYSTAGGWMQVKEPTIWLHIDAQEDRAEIAVTFSLPGAALPLVPVSTTPTPGAPAPDLSASTYPDLTEQPTLVARLDPQGNNPEPASTSTYALLSSLLIHTIQIAVKVDGLVPTRVSGPSGTIDPSQNFAVFGLSPVRYSALQFSAAELFVKRIDHLETRIEWVGLPVTTTGFKGHYKGYKLDADGLPSLKPLFDNASFRVVVDIVAPGLWTLPVAAPFYLFQTADGAGDAGNAPPTSGVPVLQQSVLTVRGIQRLVPPPYYDPADGATRLSLVGPSYAFGNTLYASNLLAASQANATAAQVRTAGVASVRGQLANAKAANASAGSTSYAKSVDAAVDTALSALNAQAYAALQAALSDDAVDSSESLQAALSNARGRSWGYRLRAMLVRPGEPAVTAALQMWMAAHADALEGATGEIWSQAEATLAAAETLASDWKNARGHATAAARTLLAAALERIEYRLAAAIPDPFPIGPDIPNQPWLPSASTFSLGYRARTTFDVAGTGQDDADAEAKETVSVGVTPDRFLHLAPFSDVRLAGTPALTDTSGPGGYPSPDVAIKVSLLPAVQGRAAFYVELSAPVPDISLLFVLSAGPDGWTVEAATPRWEKKVGDQWVPITAVSDTTNGLNNSGIVALQIATSEQGYADVAQSLRAVLPDSAENGAYVVSVTANAVNTTWVGPGGAATLGEPLPAGTIQQSKDVIAGIGTIAQPMQSIGGAPPLGGSAFHLWMAERLRHKGFAIDAWDYARLALGSVPSLWQLAVVPATDGTTGRAAPGHVWVVPVAGPQTPNVSDPTIPTVDPSVLSEIGTMLTAVASPFATLTVSNPPYLRLTVQAVLVFSDTDTPTFWIETLQNELVQWLSPWPAPKLRPRPAQYYTRQEIAAFIRGRSYVEAIQQLEVLVERDPADGRWHYFTSALQHELFAYTPPTPASRSAPAWRAV